MLNYTKAGIVALAAGLILAVSLAVVFLTRPPTVDPPHPTPPAVGVIPGPASTSLTRFTSEQELRDYLARAQSSSAGFGLKTMRALEAARAPSLGLDSLSGGETGAAPAPDRVSGTNVQVIGIDEPDILKTDGKTIFLSSPNYYYGWRGGPIPMMEQFIEPMVDRVAPSIGIMPPQPKAGVKSIKAFPPADLKVLGSIDTTGDLLLTGSTLIVFQYNKVVGYNIADPAKPAESWAVDLKDNTQFVAARLNQGRLYIITRSSVNYGKPCPMVPLDIKGVPLSIPCTDIYHPAVVVPADVTYTVAAIDPASGESRGVISLVGSSQEAPVYMSTGALYVSYAYQGDQVAYFYNFLSEQGSLVPAWFMDRLAKLRGYDLSDEAKMTELTKLMERWQVSLSADERLKLENELANRLGDYSKAHSRELERTGIAKIRIPDLTVAATGSVPGRLLNQFALDEYQTNLRVATTVGESGFWGFGMGGRGESVSDVYVLGSDLRELGSVKDLGRGERIYSVRFMGDEGYVVTFRQVDPFYVLNLAQPTAPTLAGELKIPGFSSYLHPLAENRILGVGQEGGQVKLSIFDVSNPASPREAAKYLLDDYWSEVSSTHHAFLQDAKHGVFFLPGGKGGYIFSYQGDELKLVKAVSGLQARRALYLNDYLYVLGDDRIVVLSEQDWERVKELQF